MTKMEQIFIKELKGNFNLRRPKSGTMCKNPRSQLTLARVYTLLLCVFMQENQMKTEKMMTCEA